MNYTTEELLLRRLAGVLPTILILDTWYLVDVQHQELRAAENAVRRIDLDSLPLASDGKSYRFYFEPKAGLIQPTETPDTVLVIIPHEKILDPVGVARSAGLKDTALLDTYPIIEKHIAAVSYPLKRQEQKTGGLLRRILGKKKGKGI